MHAEGITTVSGPWVVDRSFAPEFRTAYLRMDPDHFSRTVSGSQFHAPSQRS